MRSDVSPGTVVRGFLFDNLQDLVAGAADPSHPATAGEGVGWAEPGRCGRGGETGSRGGLGG